MTRVFLSLLFTHLEVNEGLEEREVEIKNS